MKITRVETIPVNVPLRSEFMIRSAHGEPDPVSTFVLVRLHTDEGITGVGECTGTASWSGESQPVARAVIDHHLAPAVLGEDPTQIENLNARMARAIKQHPFAKAALEMALWDLAGKHRGVPVVDLLGGVVRDTLPLKWSISARPPAEAAELARLAMGMGYAIMKVKVGLDPATDVERVRAVRAAVGPEIKLGMDANAGWTVQQARWALDRLRDCDLWFMEQPVHPRNLEGMAELRRDFRVPLLADEAVWTPEDCIEVVRARAADMVSVYPGKNGGILNCRNLIAIAQAAGLPCVFGSNLELGVASAAMLHLGCASAGISPTIGHHVIGPLYHQDDVVRPRLQLANATGKLPDGVGLGVELDEAKLESFRPA